jgi:hypothetical protein
MEELSKEEKLEQMPESFRSLVYAWQHPIVLHKDIIEFTAGALSRSRLANIRCDREGPPSFRIMKKSASDPVDLAWWIYERTEKMNNKKDN